MVLTLEQRVFLQTYLNQKPYKLCQKAFRKTFNIHVVPTKSAIWKLVKRFRDTGGVLDKHRSGRPGLSEEIVDDIRNRLEQSPSKSLRRLSAEAGISYGPCQKASRKLKLHAYRVSIVQGLKAHDEAKRVAYCRWFQQHIRIGLKILDRTFFTDEAWFHLCGSVWVMCVGHTHMLN